MRGLWILALCWVPELCQGESYKDIIERVVKPSINAKATQFVDMCPTHEATYGCVDSVCNDAVYGQCTNLKQKVLGEINVNTRRLDSPQNRKLDTAYVVATLTFEGIPHNTTVGNAYISDGITVVGGAAYVQDITFVALHTNLPNPNTIMMSFAPFIIINAAAGFQGQVELTYTSPFAEGTVLIYSEPDGQGTLLNPPDGYILTETDDPVTGFGKPTFPTFETRTIAFDPSPFDPSLLAKSVVLGGLAQNIGYDDITLGLAADVTEPPTEGPIGPSGDPWMVGFQGQRFFFDGEDAKWYNCISDPIKKININMRMSRLKGFGTFTDGVGIVVMGENDVKHTIALTVAVDKQDFNPACKLAVKEGEDEPVCLGDGAVTLVVDGVTYASPGHVLVEDGFNIYAVNAPFGCKKIPDAHYHWEEQVAHMAVVVAQEESQEADSRRRRKLLNADVRSLLDYLMSERGMFDEVTCVEWAVDRLTENDLYAQTGNMATIFIDSPIFSLRLEYTRNEDETTWAKHHRFDWFLSNYHPYRNGGGGASVGGILGETGVIQHDRTGLPVLGDRFSILSSPKDSDYEVEGPFGDQFVAKKR